MEWWEYILVTIIGLVGISIVYKALQDPLDMLFGFIGRMWLYIINKIQDMGEGPRGTEITYG